MACHAIRFFMAFPAKNHDGKYRFDKLYIKMITPVRLVAKFQQIRFCHFFRLSDEAKIVPATFIKSNYYFTLTRIRVAFSF